MAKHDEHEYNIDQLATYRRIPKQLIKDLKEASPLIPNLVVNVFRLTVNLRYLHESTRKVRRLKGKSKGRATMRLAISEVSNTRVVVRSLIKNLEESLR